MDDIIFGATKQSLCEEFTKLMQEKFEMSMIEELTFLDYKLNKKRKKYSLTKPNILEKYLRSLVLV